MTNFSKEKEEKEEAGGEEKKKMTLWEAKYKFQQLPVEKRYRRERIKKGLAV